MAAGQGAVGPATDEMTDCLRSVLGVRIAVPEVSMSTLLVTAPRTPAPIRSRRVERDRSSLLEQLESIDREGWDSPAGRALLRHVLVSVIRPHIQTQRLYGPAADQAEASAWSAVWESLCTEQIRSVESPWGVLWVTARRAVRSEGVAATWCMSARKAWRLSSLSVADQAPPTPLEDIIEVLKDRPSHMSTASDSLLIDRIVDTLVVFGWGRREARQVVLGVAERAFRAHDQAHIVGGWRRLAADLNLPGWQVRRLVTVLLGKSGSPGLVERTVCDPDFDAWSDPDMAEQLQSTRRPALRSPKPHAHASRLTMSAVS